MQVLYEVQNEKGTNALSHLNQNPKPNPNPVRKCISTNENKS